MWKQNTEKIVSRRQRRKAVDGKHSPSVIIMDNFSLLTHPSTMSDPVYHGPPAWLHGC